jgi:hypothetical protein
MFSLWAKMSGQHRPPDILVPGFFPDYANLFYAPVAADWAMEHASCLSYPILMF